jgi:O-antigen/teichoic acid export membrane protein
MKEKSISNNYIYNLLYQILVIIIPLITTPYLSRVLGAESIGIYSYTISIVTYFILFGSLGINMYGQREIAFYQDNYEIRAKKFIEIQTLKTITLSISMILFYIFFGINGGYKLYFSILLIEMLSNIFDISWFFQGMEEFKEILVKNTIVKLVNLTFIFIFVKNPSDLIIYFLIYVVFNLLGNLSLWLNIIKYIGKCKIRKLDIFSHIKPAIALLIPQIAIQIYTVLDKTMLGAILHDMTEVGYYEQSQKMVSGVLAIITAFSIVMVPRIANTYTKKDFKKIEEYISQSFNLVWFLGVPLMIGIITTAPNFVPWFYGPGYEKVITLLQIFSPIILAIGFNNVLGIQLLLPTKREKIFTITVVIGAVTNLIINAILILKFKSYGVALASVIAETVIFLTELIYVRKEINLVEFIKMSFKYVVSGIIMGILVSYMGMKLNISAFNTCLQALVGVITYLGLLLILRDKFLISISKTMLRKIFK